MKLAILKDHPRICGEKGELVADPFAGLGSPPRMREKAKGADGGDPLMGITPAYAGKSGAPTWATAATGDHPRVCGEKLMTPRAAPAGAGSPPRMRGKAFNRVL